MEDLAPTPLLRQYQEIKKSYPDAILFFRLGDFYEMFFDDARIAAPILEVVLTSRNKNKEGAVPLCGVPHHAWENYAAKLLRKGFKVAICEQMEDPALAKGIVRREVTHVLTPATALEVEALDGGLNNFIAVIRRDGGCRGPGLHGPGGRRFRGEDLRRRQRRGAVQRILPQVPQGDRHRPGLRG